MTDPPSRLPIRTASGQTLPARPPSRCSPPESTDSPTGLVASSNRPAMDRGRRRCDGRRTDRPRRRCRIVGIVGIVHRDRRRSCDGGRRDDHSPGRTHDRADPDRDRTRSDHDGAARRPSRSDHRGAHHARSSPATAPPLDDEPSVVARPVPVEPPPPPPAAPPAPWADSVFTTAGWSRVDRRRMRPRSLGRSARRVLRRTCRSGHRLGLPARLPARWRSVPVVVPGHVHRPLEHRDDARECELRPQLRARSRRATASGCSTAAPPRVRRRSSSGPAPPRSTPGSGRWAARSTAAGSTCSGPRCARTFPDPKPPDGLGWHPVATHIAAYDPNTLARLDFRRATSGGASPIYGYAVESDATHTYLFGNTFEQNLSREGGWFNGPAQRDEDVPRARPDTGSSSTPPSTGHGRGGRPIAAMRTRSCNDTGRSSRCSRATWTGSGSPRPR